MVGVIGGISCTDFCGYSQREKEAGKTMVPFCNFMMDIRIVRPLFWLTEISGADKDYYASKTEDVYDIFSVTTEPIIEGWPHWRERLYCFGNDRERCGFTCNRDEYCFRVCRKCKLTAKDFLIDNEGRQRLAWKMAAARGNCFLKGTKDIPLMSQLTGFQYQSFVKHIELYEPRKGRGSSSGLNVDLDQNPSHASLSWALNPLITHGHIAFVDEGCLMTGEEHFLAQMEATPNACPQLDIPSEWRSPLSEFIKVLSKTINGQEGLKRLAGNGMSLNNLFSFKLYCLSNLQVPSYA